MLKNRVKVKGSCMSYNEFSEYFTNQKLNFQFPSYLNLDSKKVSKFCVAGRFNIATISAKKIEGCNIAMH